jgi:hypothetical protein
MNIRFVLISEGTSDDGLIPHLESLCMEAGADEVSGFAPDLSMLKKVGHSLADKIPTILKLEPHANLLFLHRDADARDSSQRHDEIRQVASSCEVTQKWVAVVPVQETEAWLLLDETAIRAVAGKPNGRAPLNLPRPAHLENVATPKEVLKNKLTIASELTGRRHKIFKADYPSQRRRLLNKLPIGGLLLDVPSWISLKSATEAAIRHLRAEQEATGLGLDNGAHSTP